MSQPSSPQALSVSVADFRGDVDLVLVDVLTGGDGRNRCRFVAYWLDGQVRGGVRGQVFRSDLDVFVATAMCRVRILHHEVSTALTADV